MSDSQAALKVLNGHSFEFLLGPDYRSVPETETRKEWSNNILHRPKTFKWSFEECPRRNP